MKTEKSSKKSVWYLQRKNSFWPKLCKKKDKNITLRFIQGLYRILKWPFINRMACQIHNGTLKNYELDINVFVFVKWLFWCLIFGNN